MTVQSLVVTKRALPVFLTSDVPPLLVKGTAVERLIATPSRLRSVFHSDVGKRIKHRGQVAVITNVHEDLREIEIEDDRFWVPRQIVLRRELKEQRLLRLFVSGAETVFSSPCWTGDTRPHNARRVSALSRFPSAGFLTHLVKDLGYDGNAAFAAMTHAHQPWLRSVDRRRGDSPHQYSSIVCVKHPYVVAAPSRRTKTGGGFTEGQVSGALAGKRWDEAMKKAVYQVVYRRRSALAVSNESGIPVELLAVYASRLRTKIRKPNSHAEGKAA